MRPKQYAFLLTQLHPDGSYEATSIAGWGWFADAGAWKKYELFNHAAHRTSKILITSPGLPPMTPFSVVTATRQTTLAIQSEKGEPCVQLSGDISFGLARLVCTGGEKRSDTPSILDWILACCLVCRAPHVPPQTYIKCLLGQTWLGYLTSIMPASPVDTKIFHDRGEHGRNFWQDCFAKLATHPTFAPAFRNNQLLLWCATDFANDVGLCVVTSRSLRFELSKWGLAHTGRPLNEKQWAADEIPGDEDETKRATDDKPMSAPSVTEVDEQTEEVELSSSSLYLMRFTLYYAFWMSSLGLPICIPQATRPKYTDLGARWQIAGQLGLPMLDAMLLCHRSECDSNEFHVSDFYERAVHMPLEFDLRDVRVRMICALPPTLDSQLPVDVVEVRRAHGPVDPIVCGLLTGFCLGEISDRMCTDEYAPPYILSHSSGLMFSHGWKTKNAMGLWELVAVYGLDHAEGALLRASLTEWFDLVPLPPAQLE